MNIQFEKLEVQNFKSVGEVLTLDYNSLKGLNFVYGKNLDVPNAKNASGKSSLMIQALVFALFGKTLKNTNNKYIPNRIFGNKLKSYSKIYFKVDGVRYSCQAYGKFGGETMGSIGMELLKIDQNDNIIQDLTQSSVIKTKEYIQENLIGCTFDIFKSSIIISSSDFMNFYEGMGKDAKRKYIENIFNLNCFGEMYSLIKSDLNDTKKEMTYAKNDLLKETESIENLTKKFEEFNQKNNEQQNDLKKKIVEKKKQIDNLKKAKEEINVNDSTDLKNKIKELKNLIEEKQNQKYSLEKQTIKNDSEIKHIKTLIVELKNIKDGLCDKCKKLMDDRYDLNKNVETIKSLVENNKNNEQKSNILVEEILKLKDEYSSEKQNYDSNLVLVQKVENLTLKIQYTTNDIKSLKEEYDSTKKQGNNPYEELLKKAKDDLESIKLRLVDYNKSIKHMDVLKDACSENGIKKFIIKDIVKLLNSLIQKYLNEIGGDMLVFFDETMEFKFLTQSGECEFSSFSAGEKQRIQIATIFAFRDLILNGKIQSNVFIIDEMLDMNVDSICIEHVMNILKQKALDSNQSIFIISHRSELADNEGYWNNIIKVSKQFGKSTYEVR